MSTIPHRAELLAVIGSPCPDCGQTMQIPDRPPSRDHIKPRSKGYRLAGNLALVCCRCNTDKGSLSIAGPMEYPSVASWRPSRRSCGSIR
jgi:5-methylcytosine-specific restriction endonuclease McrA